MEYKPCDSDRLLKSEEMYMNFESESEDEYEWLEMQPYSDTYFTLTNLTGQTMKKGDQAFNCYARQPNIHFLANYGFSFEDNTYNNYKLYLSLDLKFNKKQPVQIKDMMACANLPKNKVVQIILQHNRFSTDLLCYLRYALKHDFFKINPKNIPVT